MSRVLLYDTTLRDGTQAEDVSFTVEDKLRIARKLDFLGIHYIEGGWPGANPKDLEFFAAAANVRYDQAKIVAFGSTRKPDIAAEKDPDLAALLDARTPAVAIYGKSWDFQVTVALEIGLEENLNLIRDTVRFLKRHGREVLYDAEHFFDGYRGDPAYALSTLRAAEEAGADWLVLCDTNGGTLTSEVGRIVSEVRAAVRTPLGVHCHNDCELAVANSVEAVRAGVAQVQGTVNGYGERCGNANLVSIIPNLVLKLDRPCLVPEKLGLLREVSRFVAELANIVPAKHQPYVGDSAFAHKGGRHVSAVLKDPRTYEHVAPESVGNHRRVLVSEQAGKGNVLYKAQAFGLDIDRVGNETVTRVVGLLKERESQGYQFEAAEASFELLMRRATGWSRRYFRLIGFRVIDERRHEGEQAYSEATIMVEVDGKIEHTAAEGVGPVNALDNALRKALERFYPELRSVRLIDYKVRVLTSGVGTNSQVRVLIESGDGEDTWGTVGVSENIIEASWEALVDSLVYKLYKGGLDRERIEKDGSPGEDPGPRGPDGKAAAR